MGPYQPLVLVVDDDTVYLDMLADLLDEEGYRVRAITKSSEAFALIKADLPDLVLLDLRLQEACSGWAILELLRRDQATARIPVLLCSADARFLHDHAAQLQNMNAAALEKPFLLDDLLASIRGTLGKGRASGGHETSAWRAPG